MNYLQSQDEIIQSSLLVSVLFQQTYNKLIRMGCGDSTLSQDPLTPYPNGKMNAASISKAIFGMSKSFQFNNKFTEQDSRKYKLTFEQILKAYEKVNGNVQLLFDELSERISQYYMSLSAEVIGLMGQHKLSQLQTKILLSQQILLLSLDILKVVGIKTNYKFPVDIFKIFNKAQSVLIDYLKQKYPRAGNIFIPGDLTGIFKSFDMVENPQNDMLRNSGFCFTDSTNQQIIKKLKMLFNSLIDEIDLKFPIFKAFLQQKIFTYEFEGRKKVMNYKIGRKLPQNTGKYQIDQVDSLTINSPQLFRMIIKWVGDMEQFLISTDQQVNQKTSFKYYNIYKDQVFFDQITPEECAQLDQELKLKLKQLQQPYYKSIKNLLRQMDMFNFNLLKILYTTERKQKFVPKSEAFVIKYAMHNTKLVSWLLTQKLIYVLKNLIDVGQELQKTTVGKKLDLIKFNVTDLLRAMVVGTKKQILMVYEKIKKLEKQGEMKIVKMKNRLGTPLNDVMIIFAIKESFLICQLQLVLSQGEGVSDKLKNIEFLNHFLYELIRSPYGILSQVAILLGFKDNKINYEDKISFENKQFEDFKPCSQSHPESIITQLIQLKPFICTQCTQFYQPLQNIFGLKKCEKCFIYQCCKCSFNKHKELEDYHINQRFLLQLSCDITGDRNKKSIFQFISKDIGIDIIMKCFHTKKFFFKNLFKKHYQKLTPKDVYSFIKRRNFQIPELEQATQIYFLIVQFKGENTTIKCYFWNSVIEQIQNCFKPQQIFMQNQKVSSSYYDFIIFLDASFVQDSKPQAQQKTIKLCLKPEISIQNIKNFKAVKIPTKKKDLLAFLVIRFQPVKTTKIEGADVQEQQMLAKKQFMYASIEQARKSLPEVAIIKEIFQMKNYGITTPLLKYFSTCLQKTKLKTINLNNNKLTDISIILKECVNVENILVGKNFIKQVKITVILKNLVKLFVYHNKLTKISGLQNAPSLQKLNLQQNGIKNLQAFNLKKLNQLIVSSNEFESLQWLQKSVLPQMESLSMQQSDKTYLHSSDKEYTFTLPKLKKLTFQRNKLKCLTILSPHLTFLDCTDCNLTSLKFDSSKMEHLRISSNCLQNLDEILSSKCERMKSLIGDAAGTMKKIPKINAEFLQYLSLISCSIQDISNLQSSKLPHLRQILLSYNQFLILPDLNIHNLKILGLEGVYLTNIAQASNFYLPSLQQLHLSGNYDIQFPQFPFLSLASLKTLRLDKFKFKNLNNLSTIELPVLENLYFSQIQADHFPTLKFYKVLNLEITSCIFKNLSGLEQSQFTNLLSLQIVNLNGQIQNAAEQSKLKKMNCPKLNRFSANSNQHFVIDNFFDNKPVLQSLNIYQCKCQTLPILNLPQLKELSINYSQVSNIQNLGLSNLNKVQTLSMIVNQIAQVPKISMQSLKDLQLSNNKIVSLDELRENNLPNLEEINLTSNLLTEFPALKLKNLKRLLLLQNPLQRLEGLTKSKINNLERFSISNCTNLKITVLPILNFPKVSTFQITNCNITSLDNLQKSNLPSLQTIVFQQLQVTSMPVLKLPNLTTFTMLCSSFTSQQRKPSLKDLSKMSQWECPRLQSITLNYSQAQKFPNLTLERLIKLQFDNNKFNDTSNLRISQLPQLDDINFRFNSELSSIDIPTSCLLQMVNYSDCKLENLTDISGFKSENLYLNNAGIKQITSANLAQTQYFSIQQNNIEDLKAFLTEAPKMQSLYISNNLIRELPRIQFPVLVNLVAYNNKIAEINLPEKMYPQLNYVNLQGNLIERITQLSSPALVSINLRNNKLTTIDCFSKPFNSTLSELYLDDNQISKIVSLPACSNIYLNNNLLADLNWVPASKPEEWSYVAIEFNKLRDVSGLNNKLNKFANLYHLTLNNNQITKIDFNSVCFKALQSFYANNNKIQVIDNLTNAIFPSLSILECNGNQIKKFGPNINLTALSYFDLSSNLMQGIDGLDCKQLSDLQLGGCRLKSLNWVTHIKCPQLATLNVQNNQITVLPNMSPIPKLTLLNLDGNRLQKIDEFLNTKFQNAKSISITYSLKEELSLAIKKQMKNQIRQFAGDSTSCQNVQLQQEYAQGLMVEPLTLDEDGNDIAGYASKNK